MNDLSRIIWEVKAAYFGTKRMYKLLAKGFEPFGVFGNDVGDLIYFRRVKEIER